MKLHCQESDYLTEHFHYFQKSDIQITRQNWQTDQLSHACIVEETHRKEVVVPAWDCVASYIYDTNGKLKMISCQAF